MKFTQPYLNNQRQRADAAADELVNHLFTRKQQTELYELFQLKDNELVRAKSSSTKDFLLARKPLPVWFDEKKLKRGQQVFEAYAMEIMTLLGALALPYCYAGSPGNKALYLSEKMRKAPGKRLFDTAQFIISVSTPGGLTQSGTGHIHINKTRLIHAIARYYLQQGNWNAAWGQPINQEDMAGTNLAFSYIILLGLQKSGFILTEKEKEDFLYLWRYIGYQLNVDQELLPDSFQQAATLARTIEKRNFKKSEESVGLAKELMNYYKTVVPPRQAIFIESQLRYFLGPEVAGYLGLEENPIRDGITSVMSTFKELKNIFQVHTPSYMTMIASQQRLKIPK
jgi:hypothetical protein